MFKSIIHNGNVSLKGEMQHLQNSIIGRAKAAIEGYGDSYHEALKELESRFRKPCLVLKVTLQRLAPHLESVLFNGNQKTSVDKAY